MTLTEQRVKELAGELRETVGRMAHLAKLLTDEDYEIELTFDGGNSIVEGKAISEAEVLYVSKTLTLNF